MDAVPLGLVSRGGGSYCRDAGAVTRMLLFGCRELKPLNLSLTDIGQSFFNSYLYVNLKGLYAVNGNILRNRRCFHRPQENFWLSRSLTFSFFFLNLLTVVYVLYLQPLASNSCLVPSLVPEAHPGQHLGWPPSGKSFMEVSSWFPTALRRSLWKEVDAP